MPRIDPYPPGRSRKAKIPVGVLNSNGTISGESGARILYCQSASPALRFVRKFGGTATVSRTRGSTRWVRFESGGVTIYPGSYCSDSEEVIAWRDYCHAIGIPSASVAAMAQRLMRTTIAGYFDIHDGDGIPWRLFPPGPRMHALPGLYRDVAQADIRAAYLWSIGELSPPVYYEQVGHRQRVRPSTLISYPGSWAEVSYRLNHHFRFGPIAHIREDGTTSFPRIEGQWSAPVLVSSFDLENILRHQDRAADIRIRRAWIATKTVPRPFYAFMCLITELRKQFPSMAKQAGNTLWGTFGASTDLSEVTFSPMSHRHTVRNLPPRPPLSIPVAALTLARLRARTIEVSRWTHTVHIHTDGYMTISSDVYPQSPDGNPGEWRLANKFREVEILSPSWYRYIGEDGVEGFKLAGRPETGERARRIFSHYRDRVELERG